MNNIILTSDWHLDDKPENEYRWAVWDHLRALVAGGIRTIFMLGDLCEHKDKHSAALVNRIIWEIQQTCEAAEEIDGCLLDFTIMLGNHDKPLTGHPFWSLLDDLRFPVCFITEPTQVQDMLFLPYSADPAQDWRDVDYKTVKVVFAHQTFMGAKAEGSQHRELDGLPGIPKFPKHVKVYSGDIHLPQLVLWGAPVTYVGAPHRVRYGDDHVCRMLALDSETYEIAEELVLDSPLKAVIDISSLEQFKGLGLAPGDMVRVRFTIPPNRIEQWAVDEADLREMASQAGITLASIEPIVEQHGEEDQPIEGFDKDPRSVLEAFAREEGLDQGLLNAGLALLAAP